MDESMRAAVAEARQGVAEGGIPIGSLIRHRGHITGRGHSHRKMVFYPIYTMLYVQPPSRVMLRTLVGHRPEMSRAP